MLKFFVVTLIHLSFAAARDVAQKSATQAITRIAFRLYFICLTPGTSEGQTTEHLTTGA
jgi:hypothetical protein